MEKQAIENIYNSTETVLANFRIAAASDGRDIKKDSRQEATRLFEIVEKVGSLLAKRGKLDLLEIGIGYSFVTSALRSVFTSDLLIINAIEHPDIPLISRDDFKDHLVRTEVTLKPTNICEQPLPYDDSTFDVVVFSETIEHLPPTKVPAVLEEISRVLKKNGVAIISTPNLAAWQFRWKLLRGKKIFDPALPLDWSGGCYAHIRLYTADEIEFLLAHYGLKTTGIKYLNFGITTKSFHRKFFLKLIYFLFPSIAPEFFIFAEKS